MHAEAAKRHARERGISLSRMVEDYLKDLVAPNNRPMLGRSVLPSVRGILKKADPTEYHRHLRNKYR